MYLCIQIYFYKISNIDITFTCTSISFFFQDKAYISVTSKQKTKKPKQKNLRL